VFRLGFLGLFSERKGLAGMLEILDLLAPSATRAWEMIVAGDAQEDSGRKLVADLKARFSNRPWWPQVQWCGWVKRPLEFLSSLDLLVCPSSEFDPFPTVLLEAGQAGIPALAARVGGVPEILAEGKTGWLFAPQDWAGAAERIHQLLQSPAQVREAGERAKETIQRDFGIKRMVDGYFNVYQEHLKTRGAPASA
jgi:glycosyltransferase involved in cell wall biosynthesis